MYYGVNKEYIAKDIDDDPFAPVRRRLKIREALESIKDCYCHTGTRVYDSVDSIRWRRHEKRLYKYTKRGSRDLGKLLWMALNQFRPSVPVWSETL